MTALRRHVSRHGAYDRGLREGRAEAIAFLRTQAAGHHGAVGDQRRRAALNVAADRLEQGHAPGRPAA